MNIRSFTWTLLFLLSSTSTVMVVNAQRFLRDGFSNTMDSEFKAEMGMDDTDVTLPGMTREMIGMPAVEWELSPPSCLTVPGNPALSHHLQQYLGKPLILKLNKRRGGKLGLRAVGVTPSGKKLRAFWRPAQTLAVDQKRSTDFLEMTYDQAVRSRLSTVELEVQLPRLASSSSKEKTVPSVVYQVSIESGSMNPKAVMTRGDGVVQVYPARDKDATTCIDVGTGKVGMRLKPGLVDPSWARGRNIIRKGRSTGFI